MTERKCIATSKPCAWTLNYEAIDDEVDLEMAKSRGINAIEYLSPMRGSLRKLQTDEPANQSLWRSERSARFSSRSLITVSMVESDQH